MYILLGRDRGLAVPGTQVTEQQLSVNIKKNGKPSPLYFILRGKCVLCEDIQQFCGVCAT